MKDLLWTRGWPTQRCSLAVHLDYGLLLLVRAVGLNGFDPMILAKIPGIKTPLPMIPGGDISGEVVAYGEGNAIQTLPVGTRVLVDPLLGSNDVFGETVRGGACEYVAVPAANLVPLPDAVSFEQAAALPIAYGTAYRMIRKRGKV